MQPEQQNPPQQPQPQQYTPPQPDPAAIAQQPPQAPIQPPTPNFEQPPQPQAQPIQAPQQQQPVQAQPAQYEQLSSVPEQQLQPTEIQSQTAPEPSQLPETEPVQWQAPEYVQDHRSPLWFIGFWVVTALLMVAAAFLLRSWSFALLVPAMAAALMVYSHRPPRILSYALSDKGIYINEKLHLLTEFRSFGVVQEESIPSLTLIPVKRFRPALAVHFPSEMGEAIVDLLGRRIPMQEIKPDFFDQIIRKLHI